MLENVSFQIQEILLQDGLGVIVVDGSTFFVLIWLKSVRIFYVISVRTM